MNNDKNTFIRKITAAILAVCMAASLAACSWGGSDSSGGIFDSAFGAKYDDDSSSKYSESSYYKYDEESVYTDYSLSSTDESSEETSRLKELDPFKDLRITYTGSSPYIKVATDSSQCDSTVNEYVEFKTDDEYLSNGDEFTVTAVYSESDLEAEGFKIISDTKTYVVERQSEYITSVNGLDMTSLQAELDDKLATTTAANNGDNYFAGVDCDWYFESIASKTLKSTYLISLKSTYEDKFGDDLKYYNRYMQLYEYTINKHKTNGEKGQKKVYVIVYANNLNSEYNGTLSWDIELGSEGYGNYDSMVNDYVTKNKEYYNVTQIN